MKALITLAIKDIRLLTRDPGGLFWVLGFPLLMALFFGAIFSGFDDGGGGKISMVVVDEDHSEYSQKVTAKLRALETFSITETSLDSAQTLVRTGKKTAYLRFRGGFGEAQASFSYDTAYMELGIDPARKFVSDIIQGMLTKISFELMTDVFANPSSFVSQLDNTLARVDTSSTLGAEEKNKLRGFFGGLSDMATNFDSTLLKGSGEGSKNSFMEGPPIEKVSVLNDRIQPKSSYEITFPSAILWALIGCTMSFAVSIVTEKTRGTYTRLRLAPISRAQILASKVFACFITNLFVTLLLLVFANVVFGVRLDQALKLVTAIVATSFCFVGLMMFISVLGRTEQAIGGAGMAIMLVMSMTGGGMIPLFVMPKWMLMVSNFSFVKWGIVALEGAIWRNFSWTEMAQPLLILCVSGMILFAVGVQILKRRDIA